MPYGNREDRRAGGLAGVGSELCSPQPHGVPTGTPPAPAPPAPTGVLLLDLVFVIGVLAVFALVGLVARGVEKL